MNSKRQITLFFTLPFLLVSYFVPEVLTTLLVAQPVQFNLPSRGSPGCRRSGGRCNGGSTRPGCFSQEELIHLSALIPGTNLGLTIDSNPTFWFYIPIQARDVFFAKFLLKDKEKKEVYKITFEFTNTPGIVTIRLPENVHLEADERYRWYFTIQCSLSTHSSIEAEVSVSGGVERVEPNPQMIQELSQLAGTTDKLEQQLERSVIYAKYGLWFNTLNIIAELYRHNPNNEIIKSNWTKLLQDVDLEELASKPLVSCCNAEQ